MLGVWLQALAVVLFFVAMVASVVAFGLHRRSAFATEGDAMMSGVSLERQAPAPLPRQAASAPASQVNVNTPQALPLSTWWQWAVRDAVHLMLPGETHSGKSTTAFALVVARSKTDKILIIDPHRKFNDWPVEPVNDGRNWQDIDRLFVAIEKELDRRYTDGEAVGFPVTIFVDEFPAIKDECANAPRVFKRLVREGRKVGMRLVLLTQSPLVKALGIEGEGDVRDNLWKLLLGSFAAGIPGVNARPAALETATRTDAVDTAGLLEISKQPVSPNVRWDVQRAAPPPAAWGEQHTKVAVWLIYEPEISTRELARRLYPGTDGGGKYSSMVKAVREQVEPVLLDAVNLLPMRSNTLEIPTGERVTVR